MLRPQKSTTYWTLEEQAAARDYGIFPEDYVIVEPRPLAVGPCLHLGPALTPQEARDAKLGTLRTWRECAKGHGERGKPKGFVACCLAGSVCGPKCEDHETLPNAKPLPLVDD